MDVASIIKCTGRSFEGSINDSRGRKCRWTSQSVWNDHPKYYNKTLKLSVLLSTYAFDVLAAIKPNSTIFVLKHVNSFILKTDDASIKLCKVHAIYASSKYFETSGLFHTIKMIPSRGLRWSSQTIGTGRRRLDPLPIRQVCLPFI